MALITLTSDLGSQDFLAGAVKGQLLKRNPNHNLVDITHSINDFNMARAAYICRNALQHFPENTIHLWLINLFDKKAQYLLFAHHHGQYICCADNDLLPITLQEKPETVVRLTLQEDQPHTLLHYSNVFADAIARLESGTPLSSIGERVDDMEYHDPLPLLQQGDYVEVKVIMIDSYENVVLNITKPIFETLRKGRDFKIVLKGNQEITEISDSYADVSPGKMLALFNASGYLEIAINKGNAAGLLGLQLYSTKNQEMPKVFSEKRLMYQTVLIQFNL